MSIYLTSAMTSTYIQYNLNKSTLGYNKAMEQLSSGSKITSVADDPVGISKTAKLDIQLGANSVELTNIAQGNDILNLAEGNQSLVITNLQRMRELTMQAASETYTAEDKDAILNELNARLSEINNIASSTQYNGINLLDGTASNFTLQIGPSSGATLNIGSALIDVSASALGVEVGPVTGTTWTTQDAEDYLVKIDNAIQTLSSSTSAVGGFTNRLEDATSTLNSTANSMKADRSLISDADVASTSSDIVKFQIMQQASASILTQANQIAALALNLLSSS